MRVLLVEDQVNDREEIISYLVKMDKVQFTTAETLAVAKDKLSNEPFDLILLNLDLPNGEGMELFRRVICITSTPIIILAGVDDEEVALNAAHEGAYGYVAKETLNASKLFRHMSYVHKQYTAKIDLMHENMDLRKTTRSAIERMSADSRLEQKMDTNFQRVFEKVDDISQRTATVEANQKNTESAIFKISQIPERVASIETKLESPKNCVQVERIASLNTKMKGILWVVGTIAAAAVAYAIAHINWSFIFGG